MLISTRKPVPRAPLVPAQPAPAMTAAAAAPAAPASMNSMPSMQKAAAPNGFAQRGTHAGKTIKVNEAAQPAESEAQARLRRVIHDQVFSQIDPMKASLTTRENLQIQINELIRTICDQNRFQLTGQDEQQSAEQMLD